MELCFVGKNKEGQRILVGSQNWETWETYEIEVVTCLEMQDVCAATMHFNIFPSVE